MAKRKKKSEKRSIKNNPLHSELRLLPTAITLVGKEIKPSIKIKPELEKKEIKVEKAKELEVLEKAKEKEKPEIAEPILAEWFNELEEKQREFTEFRDKSLKEVTKKLTNKLQRKDQEIAEINKELETKRKRDETKINGLRRELKEKRKLIQELQGKLGKIISELK